ncbi:hypothetical protein [Profundibacter sp.]
MTLNISKYQPGLILHESIIGSFRANSDNLHAWCERNGVNKSVVRNVTFGQTGGPKSKVLLAELIEAAGAETVSHIYERRMAQHAADLNKGAA